MNLSSHSNGDASIDLLLKAALDIFPSRELRDDDAAACELLLTVAKGQPQVAWKAYGDKLNETGLLDVLWEFVRGAIDRPRVVGAGSRALASLADRDEALREFIGLLPGVWAFVAEAAERHRRVTATLCEVLQLIVALTHAVKWADRELVVRLIGSLLTAAEEGFVHQESDKALVGPMWRLTWSVLTVLVGESACAEERSSLAWAERALAVVERNFKHWECLYPLTFVSSDGFRAARRAVELRAAPTLLSVLRWHARGGQACQGRLCSQAHADDSVKRVREDWGDTISRAVDLLSGLMVADDSAEVAQAVFTVAVSRIDRHVIVADVGVHEMVTRTVNMRLGRSMVVEHGGVSCLAELLSSHSHYTQLAQKVLHLLLILTVTVEDFPANELYCGGRGVAALLEGLTAALPHMDTSAVEVRVMGFVAPLMLMAQREGGSVVSAVVERWDVVTMLLDRAPGAGLRLLLAMQRRSKEQLTPLLADGVTAALARDCNPVTARLAAELLVNSGSPVAEQLCAVVPVAQLIAVAFYWMPRPTGVKLVADPTPQADTVRLVVKILSNLSAWIEGAWKSSLAVPLELRTALERGLVTTVASLLWQLPDDSVPWRACADCAYHLFRLDEQGVSRDQLGDWIVRRKTNLSTPASFQRYRAFINSPNIDQGLWAFTESLFVPCFASRGVDFSKEIIAPPPLTPERPQSAPAQRRCAQCLRREGGVSLMRCGGCKKVCYCDRTCQARHWAEHRPKCAAQAQEK